MRSSGASRVVVLALALGLTPAVAVTPAQPSYAEELSVPLVAGSGPEPAAADLPSAAAAATQLDEPVEAGGLTTETERHLVNPDGTVTFEAHAVAQRVATPTGWTPVDTTLRVVNGRVVPGATVLKMSLSTGGSGELIRLVDGDRWLALSWPSPLPAPVLTGDTATYRDVLPGVDLVVRAAPDSFSQVLVVRTRQAGQHPGLARLTWAVTRQGLAVQVQPDGSVQAVDQTTGQVVFGSPPPVMADAPAPSLSTDAGDRGPGRIVTMPVELAGDQLTVRPDLSMLADPATNFPVEIDPSFSDVVNNWAPVFRERPTSSWPSGTAQPRNYVRVGLLNWPDCGSWCGLWRSHFRFTIEDLAGQTLIGNPEFRTTLDHSGSCSATPVSLWRTSTIGGGSVTWNEMNDEWVTDFGDRSAAANESSCGQDDVPMEWATSTMRTSLQGAMDSGNGTFTFGLRAPSEGNRDQWKRFIASTTRLVARYNARPLAPDRLVIDADCYLQCSSPAVVRTLRPFLKARVRDPNGADLDVEFQVRSGSTVVASGTASNVNSGGTASWRPGSNLPQQTLTFRVRASNADLTSPWSGSFTFTPDTSAPGMPAVSSGFYPHKDTGTWNGGVGQAGAFTFTAGSSDTIEYRYRWLGGAETSIRVSAGATQTVQLAPPGDLEQVLEVRALDLAGNTSGPRTYPILVRPNPSDVAWWKFDDGTGTVADPATGAADYTGTLRGNATWAASGINPNNPAASGTAVSLDGSGDFVEMPRAVATNHAAGFSVTAWVKPTHLTGYHAVVAQGGDNATMFLVYYKPESTQWCLRVNGSDQPEAERAWACSPATPQVDTWTHLAAVYDKPAGKIRLWVNGGPNNGEPVPGTVTEVDAPAGEWAATGSFTVGRGHRGEWFPGLIDEVRVHQRVLGEFEIQHTFLQCRFANCPPVPQPTEPVLVGQWDMDEGTGPIANDSSGMENHAALQGGAQWTTDGHGGTPAVRFGDPAGELLTDSMVVLSDQSFTVSARVRLAQSTSHNQYVVWQSGTGASSFILLYRAAEGRWGFSVTSHDGTGHHWHQLSSSSPATLGTWAHLTGVYDRQQGAIRLYVNGALAATATADVQASASPLHIGNTGAGRFYGTVDSVRTYQSALTSTQVAALFTGTEP